MRALSKLLPLAVLYSAAIAALAQALSPGDGERCGGSFHLQMEARGERNAPLGGLHADGIRLSAGREPLKVLSMQSLSASSAGNAETSLLILLWPEAQIDAHGANELLDALRLEEKVDWRVAVVSPSIRPLVWHGLDDLAGPLQEATRAAARMHLVATNPAHKASRLNVNRWTMVVRGTAEALLSQPGRHVILEIAPKPLDPPGERQLLASASFGVSPVYRLTRTGGLDASLSIPFGDASTGPYFGRSGNPSQIEQNDAQMDAVQSASYLDSIRRKSPQPALLFGGTNLPSPREVVHRMATDAAGAYSVVASTPAGCNAHSLYPLTFAPVYEDGSRPRGSFPSLGPFPPQGSFPPRGSKTRVYGPRSLYYPLIRNHP